jgi:hypothetical protein
MRRTLGLLPEDDGTGVRVAKINRFASAEGLLEEDDVVLEIDGVTIGSDQTVALRRLERIEFQYLISSRTTDHSCTVKIIRGGVRQVLQIPLKPELSLIPLSTSSPNCAPSYLIVGGLVFVPLSRPWIVASKKNAIILQQVRPPGPGVGVLRAVARAWLRMRVCAWLGETADRKEIGREQSSAARALPACMLCVARMCVVRCMPRVCCKYATCQLREKAEFKESSNEQLVVLSTVLAHDINHGFHSCGPDIATHVNGQTFANLAELAQIVDTLLQSCLSATNTTAVVLDFQFNSGFRVVLDAASCTESEAEILEANKIGSSKSKDIRASIRKEGATVTAT